MSIKTVIPVIYALFFVYCNNAQREESMVNVKTLTFKDAFGALKDTSFFKSKVVLPLETNNSALIGEISRLYVGDDTLFILDRNFRSVIIYDKVGKYINCIQKVGTGPKEYVDLGDICVDNIHKELIVLCTRPSKLQFYSYQGKFLREKSLGDNYYSQVGTDGKYVYLHDNTNLNQSKEIAIYDRQLKHITDALEHGNTFKNKDNDFSTVNHFGKGNSMTQDSFIHLVREFDNIIYEAKDGKVYPKYQLDFKERTLSKDLLNNQMKPFDFLDLCRKNHYVISVKVVVENPKFLLFTTNTGVFVCDKQKGEMTQYSFILDSESDTGKSDIQVIGNSNKIAVVWSVSSLKNILKMSAKKSSNEVNREFIKKINAVDDEANPILFIYDF